MQPWKILTFFTIQLLSECLSQTVVGSFDETKTTHGVKGEVVIIDDDTLQIKNFHYFGKVISFTQCWSK